MHRAFERVSGFVTVLDVAAFPLTVTLCRREREQRLEGLGFWENPFANSDSRNSLRLRIILPLPAGEGKGAAFRVTIINHLSKTICCSVTSRTTPASGACSEAPNAFGDGSPMT